MNISWFNELEHIARQIKKRRCSLGMTQAELAKKIGFTQQAVSTFESGRCSYSLASLVRIANALDCCLKIDFIPKQ